MNKKDENSKKGPTKNEAPLPLERKKGRKQKTPEPPEPEPEPEPEIDPRYRLPDHLRDWVNLRSKPKVLVIRRKKRRLTRFQKKGPMKPNQFKKWYQKQMLILQKVYEKTLIIAEKVQNDKYKPRRRKKNPIEFIDWWRLEELAWPKWFMNKFEIPLEEVFPFSPKIHANKPAKKGKGRPFIQKQIPPYFMHQILEMDFWYNYRFPVNKDAQKFKTTSREERLSIPKAVSASQQVADPPRKKMTKSQWLRHLKYLKFFAIAKSKMFPRERRPNPKRGKKICLTSLLSGIERLATPKKHCESKDKDSVEISKLARNAKASQAIQRLAKPKKRLEDQYSRKDPYEISKSAKSAKPSARIAELSIPKKFPSRPEKSPWKPLVTRKGKSQYSYVCPKREGLFPCINYTNLVN